MSESGRLPAVTRAWLRDVRWQLGNLPRTRRDEVMAVLSREVADPLERGEDPEGVIMRMGSPVDVAQAAVVEYAAETGRPVRDRYLSAKRGVQLVALGLAVAAALTLTFWPFYTEVTQAAGSGGTVNAEVITSATLVQVTGAEVLLFLAVPVVLTLVPVLVRGAPWQPVSAVNTVLLVIFTMVFAFSIGVFFFPAVLVSLAALLLRPRGTTTPATSVR